MKTVTGKRKRSISPPPSPHTETLARFATRLKKMPKKLSLLLDFPPEVRNIIYSLVLAGSRIVLPRGTGRQKTLIITSALMRVNKQIRDEATCAAWVSADIYTETRQCDFRHIVTFLNRLSHFELKALPSTKAPASRKVIIELTDLPSCAFDEAPFLRRWLNRAGHPTKQGTNIDCKYVLPPLPVAANSDKQKALKQLLAFNCAQVRGRWKEAYSGMPKGRVKEELGKIMKALKAAEKAAS